MFETWFMIVVPANEYFNDLVSLSCVIPVCFCSIPINEFVLVFYVIDSKNQFTIV